MMTLHIYLCGFFFVLVSAAKGAKGAKKKGAEGKEDAEGSTPAGAESSAPSGHLASSLMPSTSGGAGGVVSNAGAPASIRVVADDDWSLDTSEQASKQRIEEEVSLLF